MSSDNLWARRKRYHCYAETVALSVDISRMSFDDSFFTSMADPMRKTFDEMSALESGVVANPDQSRRVGHYWLRTPELSPTPQIRRDIVETLVRIKSFAADVHSGRIEPQPGKRFANLLLIGIGGSALGPQFVADALAGPNDNMRALFCDNTDPDGVDRILARLGSDLDATLTVVTSKSGSTKETRNTMLEVRQRYAAAGLDFSAHAVAITADGSELDRLARRERWLKRFEMWDWIGGRTSELSAVGLVPAALQGIDIDALLDGASRCDAVTRVHDATANPAALLALMWFAAGRGKGEKNMIVIPYKDRLALLSRYLQQLIMESLGKKVDRDGRTVHQGITVYGNKGSTDQHAYVQQLRDGTDDFFVTFIEVLRDREGESLLVEEDVTSGDYLHGFLHGTRRALFEAGRQSITITIDEVSARSVGVLIALFERAVGFYASLINVNAYHQPGVEAGKKAAEHILKIQRKLLRKMRQDAAVYRTAEEWAETIGVADDPEAVFGILEHLAANPDRRVVRQPGSEPCSAKYGLL